MRKPTGTGGDMITTIQADLDGADLMPLPLGRFTVLEVSVARAGPSAGRTLADWGANVIRIEPPEAIASADELIGRRFGSDRLNLHRNKKSLTLNLKTPEGRAIFMELVKKADVVIENMRPDVKRRLGVDYESVREVNPRIVYGSISGFGQTGPYRDRAGVDQIAQGMGGLMSVTGLPGQGPVRAGVALVDLSAGAFLVQAILIALLEREVTGQGRWVHTSLIESMISLLDFQATRWLMDGEVAGQAGNNHPTGTPSGLFPTADGQLQIAATGDRVWTRFCTLAGAEHLLEDPRYSTGNLRLANRDALNAEIAEVTRTKSSRHWFELFSEGGVPCGPVYAIDQVFADEQVRHLDMVLEAGHPERGNLRLVASPANIEGVEKRLRQVPPALGEHTDAILHDLGYSDETIGALRERIVL